MGEGVMGMVVVMVGCCFFFKGGLVGWLVDGGLFCDQFLFFASKGKRRKFDVLCSSAIMRRVRLVSFLVVVVAFLGWRWENYCRCSGC